MRAALNVESVFALAGLLLLWIRGRAESPPQAEGLPHKAWITLIALTFLAYWRTLGWYFLSDDFLLLKHARSAWTYPAAQFLVGGGDGFYRPIGYLALGLMWRWAGISPAAWHFAGLVLHAANAVLVLFLASKLGMRRIAAWFAAALFIVHGTRPEPVIWLAGRFDLLATFFVLLGLLAFLRDWHSLALLSMTLGILSKESAYAFPLLLLLFGWRRVRVLVPYFAVAAGLVIFRWTLFHGIGGYSGGGVSVLAALKALLLRLWAVLFFPVNWSTPIGVTLGLTMAVYVGALLWLFTAQVPRERLLPAIGFTLIAALPPIQQLLIGADLQKSRLLYLPSIGFCLLIGMVLEYLRPRAGTAVAAAILLFQFAALWHNMNAWRDASEKARAVCSEAARTGVMAAQPGSLNGVYFFANGFPECVELQKAGRPQAGELPH
jgi:uncharacterized membrane protein